MYWLIYVLNTAISYKFAKYSILFTANQEYKTVRVIQGLSKILVIILQIIVIIKLKSFLIFILLLILENILQYLFYRRHYLKKYSFIINTKEKDQSIKKISLTVVDIYSSYILIIGTLVTIVTMLLILK